MPTSTARYVSHPNSLPRRAADGAQKRTNKLGPCIRNSLESPQSAREPDENGDEGATHAQGHRCRVAVGV